MVKRKIRLTISLFIIINFVARVAFSDMPAHFDEVGFLQGLSAIEHNSLNPFIYFWGYRPPAMFAVPAIISSVLFHSRIWARLFIYLCSSGALYLTYILGKKLFNERVGLFSILILSSTPLFITQSFLFQDPLPLTAAFLATLYFYLFGITPGYLVAATVLVLTKETAVLIPLFFFFYNLILLRIRKTDFGHRIKSGLHILIPVSAFFLWMVGNKVLLGWYLWPPNVVLFSPAEGIEHLRMFINTSIRLLPDIQIWLMLLSVPAIIMFRNLFNTGQRLPHGTVISLFICIFVFYVLLHYTYAYLHFRYLLFVYPLLITVFCVYLVYSLPEKVSTIIIMFFCITNIVSNTAGFVRSTTYGDGDNDIRLFGQISLDKNAISYVSGHHPGAAVVAPWPLNKYWEDPYLGYVSNPGVSFELTNCEIAGSDKAFIRKRKAPIVYITYKNSWIGNGCPNIADMHLQRSVHAGSARNTDTIYIFGITGEYQDVK